MAYPVFFLYGQHFLVNFIIFIVSLTTGILLIKKSKSLRKSIWYISILSVALLVTACIIFLILALSWDYPYLSFIRTLYYFIPSYIILLGTLILVKNNILKYTLGIFCLLIVYFLIWMLFIN